MVGDPLVGTAEDQNLNELLEDHPVGYAGIVAAQRMGLLPIGKQSGELVPDRVDEA